MDPCVRKATNPLPVNAPQKEGDSANVGDLLEALIVLESASEKINPKIVGAGKRERKEEETSKRPSKQLKSDEIVSFDLCVSDEEIQKDENWTLIPYTSPPKTRKPAEVFKARISKTIKSKEYISDSEDELERTNSLPLTKPSIQSQDVKRSEIKVISPKPMTTDKRCKYIFKNQPRKGIRCNQVSKEELCQTHKKVVGGTHDKESPETLKRQILELKKVIVENEKNSKSIIADLAKEVELLKESVRDSKSSIQEMNNKIEHLLTNKSSQQTSFIQTKKMHKLNRDGTYKLLRYLEGEGVFLSEAGTIKIKIPLGMNKPCPEENLALKFNKETSQFEWTKM